MEETMLTVADKAQNEHEVTCEIDISSDAFWSLSLDERVPTFTRLRAEYPVSWHRPRDLDYNRDKGFWAITKAEHIAEITRADDVFLSGLGTLFDPIPHGPNTQYFFLTQDGELHQRNRALVSQAFTPRRIGMIVDSIYEDARDIVDSVVGIGDTDFVEAVSAKLPMRVGARIIGVPDSERDQFALASNRLIARSDSGSSAPTDPMKVYLEAREYLLELGSSLAADRRKNPQDDVVTSLVSAELNGQQLSDADIGGFTALMSIGSNDTTKQSTTWSMLALDKHPEQLAWLMEDFDARIGTAVNELLRYASPVISQARTVARDVEFHGAEFTRGDKVVIFYESGNRDEERFNRPLELDLSRSPNPHIVFGGGGVHYCLGNRVATTMLQAILSELLHRVTVTITGEPERFFATSVNGVRHLPVHIQ